ncbi:MAG: dihydrofolate reductase family protein [Acidimicrobiales bacterium]
MGRLVYASNTSLDGWTEGPGGEIDWAPPDDEVFAAITEVMRSARTYLYGRRMYETMAVWETDPTLAGRSDLAATYAEVWQGADKVVFSSTLATVATDRTTLRPSFDPAEVAELVQRSDHDVLIGGPQLAGQALAAGVVDEVVLWVWPILVGGRNAALPTDVRAALELVDEHRVGNGVVALRYRVARRG